MILVIHSTFCFKFGYASQLHLRSTIRDTRHNRDLHFASTCDTLEYLSIQQKLLLCLPRQNLVRCPPSLFRHERLPPHPPVSSSVEWVGNRQAQVIA